MDTILSSLVKKESLKSYERYHVKLGKKRTTVTLDTLLSTLLSLKLNVTPESREAHKVIGQWLQARLDENNDPGRVLVSSWLQNQVMLYLLEDTPLDRKYGEWILSQL